MQGVWRRGETAGEIAMFKKIAQWIRTRQERRLREKLVFRDARFSDYLQRISDDVAFILDGTIPSKDQSSE